MKDSTRPALGSYEVFNALTYTRQILEVTETSVKVYTCATAFYAPHHLHTAPVSYAAEVLAQRDSKVYSFTPAPATIGKARAAKLHKLMGRLSIPHAQHYEIACTAARRNLVSLANLTEPEARQVWAYLKSHFARAAQYAA